jgi:hypothetical protein
MNCPLATYLTIFDRRIAEIEVVYAPGQRNRAWSLCQQILPELERLEQSLSASSNGELA